MKTKVLISFIIIILLAITPIAYITTHRDTEQQTVSQTTEQKKQHFKKENTPFCTEKEKEECETNNSSECCPFEID